MEIIYNLQEIDVTAEKIIQCAKEKSKTILFYGDMGAGKTTLIKSMAKKLGITEEVSSPTYSLVNQYVKNDITIYHFDFYRIENEEEAYDIGFEEYLNENTWCFIEWPSRISNLLPDDALVIRILIEDKATRKVLIS
jgi:tRNA threonylcarbamoyladenosine biosynthesis protein TsaE